MPDLDYKSRYETAAEMLAQCGNAFFLIGDYEVRKMEGKWWLMNAGRRVLNFDNPIDAVITAKDLMASKKDWKAINDASDIGFVNIVEADPT